MLISNEKKEKTENPAKTCVQKVLLTRKKITSMKLPPLISQKFTSSKTQRKPVNQATSI